VVDPPRKAVPSRCSCKASHSSGPVIAGLLVLLEGHRRREEPPQCLCSSKGRHGDAVRAGDPKTVDPKHFTLVKENEPVGNR